MEKLKKIFQKIKDNLIYVIFITLSVFVMEVFIDTNWFGLPFSLGAAFANFFKLLTVTIVADNIKKYLGKYADKVKILKFIFNLIVRFPLPIYAIYLLWWLSVPLATYRVADNIFVVNGALQMMIAMVLGIMLGVIASIRNK